MQKNLPSDASTVSGISYAYPIHLMEWIMGAPSAFWWTAATLVVNLTAACYAWWGHETNGHEDIVRGIGALLQCVGVVGVVIGVSNTRRLFEQHGAPRPVRQWLANRPRLFKRTHYLRRNASMGSMASMGEANFTSRFFPVASV
jgi:hypothetical protein